MIKLAYRLINVFASSPLTGNPLCVFEDGQHLDTPTMQALALQFNLSETTFILPSIQATARVRIFTPSFEMPFAGHPTLGTAQVVRGLYRTGDEINLEMQAGVIPLRAQGDHWSLQANKPVWRKVDATRAELAQMLRLDPADIGETPLWVNTGSEQLIIPLASSEAVKRCQPVPELLIRYGSNAVRQGLAYVWAQQTEHDVLARFFFQKQSAVAEDPGTGSACANLGGWLLATGSSLPQELTITQGEQLGRVCQLGLLVDREQNIFVSGRVIEIGRGEINLP